MIIRDKKGERKNEIEIDKTYVSIWQCKENYKNTKFGFTIVFKQVPQISRGNEEVLKNSENGKFLLRNN